MLLMKIVISAILVNITTATIYSKNNATTMFSFFKTKYNKFYENPILENEALMNFINNLNIITALNEKDRGSDTILVLNKYADIDTEKFEEHFAINILPYDNDTIHTKLPLQIKSVRNKIEMNPLDDTKVKQEDLYDLDEADKLYEQYMKKFNKKNATKKYDRTVHYYRFIKSLVELNKQHYKGDKTKQLDADSDVAKKPFEYIY